MSYTAILLGHGAELSTRIIFLRFWSLLAGGVFAVAVPHILLPDSNLYVLQLLNVPPPELLRHQLTILIPLIGIFALPALLLAFYAPTDVSRHLTARTLHGLAHLFVIAGSALYGFERYATIGTVSQAWQEGRRGRIWRSMSEHGPLGFSFGTPAGLIPAVTATGRIFVVVVLTVMASAIARPLAGGSFVWLPGSLLLLWTGVRLYRAAPNFDRHFYCTNAFYHEVFRTSGGTAASDVRPLPYESLYWVPGRWKPHVWASLLQLDRRLPLGRFIALGHVLLWLLAFQEAENIAVAAYLLIFSAGKNAVVALLGTRPFAPRPFQHTQQSPTDWTITRFFVNLRWTFPLLASLLIVALFDDSFTYTEAALWTGLDLFLALLTAAVVTWKNEGQHQG